MSDNNCNCDENCKCCTDGQCANAGKPGKSYNYRWDKKNRGRINDGGLGFAMFAAFIGAAVYFVSHSNGFWDGLVGILKAIVWPAFVVYSGLGALGVH